MPSLRIRRRLKRFGIPMFDISAHTTNRKVCGHREKLVDQLVGDAQIEVLRALQSGALSIEVVEHTARERGMGGQGMLAEIRLSAGLWTALEETLPKMGTAEPTRRRYETSRDQLKAKLPAEIRVRDLATVDWQTLAAQWPNSASDWMHVRRMLSRFLSVYLGSKQHPQRHAILALIPHKTEEERTSELTPAQFLALVEHARQDVVAGFWTLVLTGMRMGEYLRADETHLRPAIHAVAVPGSKTAGSKALVRVDPRLWHHIEAGIPAPLQYKSFRLAFKAALKKAKLPSSTRLHDLRHCHGQWAIDGGAAEALVQVSLRHTQAATTRRYTKQKGRADVATALAKSLTSKPTTKRKGVR